MEGLVLGVEGVEEVLELGKWGFLVGVEMLGGDLGWVGELGEFDVCVFQIFADELDTVIIDRHIGIQTQILPENPQKLLTPKHPITLPILPNLLNTPQIPKNLASSPTLFPHLLTVLPINFPSRIRFAFMDGNLDPEIGNGPLSFSILVELLFGGWGLEF